MGNDNAGKAVYLSLKVTVLALCFVALQVCVYKYMHAFLAHIKRYCMYFMCTHVYRL